VPPRQEIRDWVKAQRKVLDSMNGEQEIRKDMQSYRADKAKGRKCVIYIGISGSGKNTHIDKHYQDAVVCSADDGMMVDGEYQFDVRKLGPSHDWCMREFIRHASSRSNRTLVLNNTNTSFEEVFPYARIAEAFGWNVEFIVMHCDVHVAAERNVHGTPKSSCFGQDARIPKTQQSLAGVADKFRYDWKTTHVST